MKYCYNLIGAILILFLPYIISAQDISNPDFENWSNGMPVDWFVNSAALVTRSSTAQSGFFSARGEVKVDGNGQTIWPALTIFTLSLQPEIQNLIVLSPVIAEETPEKLILSVLTDTTIAHSYIIKAEQFQKKTEFDSAANYLEKASRIFKDNYRQDEKLETFKRYIFCLSEIANIWFKRRNVEKTLEYLNEALHEGEVKLGDSTLTMADIYHDLGDAYVEKKEFDPAIKFIEKALTIRQRKLPGNHINIARSYRSLSTVYRGKGEYEEALQLLQKAIQIKKAALGEDDPSLGHEYNSLGNVYDEIAKYDLAHEFYNKALQAFKKAEDQNQIASAYINLGNVNIRLDNLDSAINYYQKALAIKKKLFGEYHSHVAAIYNNTGILYRRKGKPRKALENLKKALAINLKISGQMDSKVASNYGNIGRTYSDFADYDTALKYFSKADSIATIALGKEHPYLGRLYLVTGVAYEEKADYEKALEYYDRALKLDLKFYGKIHPETASVYGSLGNLYQGQGDYERALEYYNQTLKIFKEIRGEKDYYVAGTYGNIANVYLSMGDLDKTIELHKKALELDIEIHGESHPYVARDYTNLGSSYKEKGEFENALDFLFKSEKIKLETQGKDHPDLGITYDNIADVYHEQGKFDVAYDFYIKSLDIYINTYGTEHPSVARQYSDIGKNYFEKGLVDSALVNYQNALSALAPGFKFNDLYQNPRALDKVNGKTELLAALGAKASALRNRYYSKGNHQNDLEKSLETYLLAEQLINSIRNGYQTDEAKLFFTEQSATLYDDGIELCIKLNQISKNQVFKRQAFSFAESRKAAVLWGTLVELKARQYTGIPNHLLEKEHNLKIDLTFYQTELQKERFKKGDRDTLKIVDFEQRFFDLNRQYEALITNLETKYPKYYDLKYRTKTASVKEVQAALDNKTALIEYSVGDSSLVTFVISKDKFDILNTPIDSTFAKVVTQFNKSIKKINRKAFLPQSQKLYATLIQPIEPHLQGKSKLVIIPDGMLYYVPFEALVSAEKLTDKAAVGIAVDFSKLEYLVKRFEISYHHSVTMFLNEQPVGKGNLTGSFIGFAPVFSDDSKNAEITETNRTFLDTSRTDEAVRSATIDGVRLNELKHSEEEVKAIVDIFKDSKRPGFGYFHGEASEENFKANIDKYRYVHIATHGLINEEEPKLSGLIFSQPSDSTYKDDGILYSGETYNLTLNADLVVLSSCESGIGKLVRGEGLMALTRGFLYAGTPNIIFSLWKVSDRYTRDLMVEFYRQVVSGKSYGQALRQAKLKMIAEEATAFPSLWSSFVLVGR